MTLLRQVRAAGVTVTAVLGDAEFGDSATLRGALHRGKSQWVSAEARSTNASGCSGCCFLRV